MLGELIPTGGGWPLSLTRPRLVVGRDRSCGVQVPIATVSSRHCELEHREGLWHVRDLGSRNGTRVNGRPCTTERLMPGDVLALAGCRFVVRYDATPSSLQAPVQARSSAPARAPTPRPTAPRTPTPGAPATQADAQPVLGELVPCGGGDPIPLRKPCVVIGRQPGSDVILSHATVSGVHCQLEWTGGAWLVRDLGSRNGVRVDGVPCTEFFIPPGCVLAVGAHRFEVCYGDAPAPTPGPKGPVFGKGLLEKAGLEDWQPPEDKEDATPSRARLDDI